MMMMMMMMMVVVVVMMMMTMMMNMTTMITMTPRTVVVSTFQRAHQRSTGAKYCPGGRFRDVAQVASDRAKPASQKATKVRREGLNTHQLQPKVKHFKHLSSIIKLW